MKTQSEIDAGLLALHLRIEDRELSANDGPEALEEAWAQLHEEAPPELQLYVMERLMDFSARLGLLDPAHHEGPWPRRYWYPVERRAFFERSLDHLERHQLPELPAECPDEADFWPELAGILDDLLEHAGEHLDYVDSRIDAILHGAGLARN
jgi:hypothetical protein